MCVCVCGSPVPVVASALAVAISIKQELPMATKAVVNKQNQYVIGD